MSKPKTKEDWKALLTAIGWARDHWAEFEKVNYDLETFGTGYFRVDSGGVKHISFDEVQIRPPVEDPSPSEESRDETHHG